MWTPEELEAIRRADREIDAQIAEEERAARAAAKAKKMAAPAGGDHLREATKMDARRAWRQRNREKLRKYHREYRARNRDRINAQNRASKARKKEEKNRESKDFTDPHG